jgi:molybdopterin-guanine dinucleotide biosynthesis protein MobB
MDSHDEPRRPPLVVAVLGLKDSGKTTVCEALIGELRSRGRRVAAVKSSHLQSLDRGRPGSDSERLARAGADYVAARALDETLEWHPRRLAPEELKGRVPAGMDVLLVEGGEPELAAAVVVVCLTGASAYAETLAVRRVPEEQLVALSGRFAAASTPAAACGDALPRVPVLDPRLPQDVARLADLILRRLPPRANHAPRTS